MANIGLVSPGVKVREVDLTVGRIDALSDQTGAICGPFSQGPVLEPILVENEQELLSIFGKPISSDRQYEYWYSASNYLQYGGVLRVARTDGANLRNANVGGVGIASTSTLKIKSYEDYKNNYETTGSYRFAARNPGTWANGLKVAVIDGAADQTLTVGAAATAAAQVGYAVTQATTSIVAGVGTTSVNDGYLQGVITGIGVSTIDVKVINRVSAAGSIFPVSYTEGGAYAFSSGTATNVGFGTTSAPGTGIAILSSSSTIASPAAGLVTSVTLTSSNVSDWYNNQYIQLDNGAVLWKSIAEKPGTSGYAAARNSKNDEVHVVVIDDKGSISGNAGTILEKHAFLSKAKDTVNSLGSNTYYKDYVADNSNYLFVGVATGNGSIASGIQTAFTATSTANVWGTNTQDVVFNVAGNQLYTLAAGKDYSGTNNEGGYSTTLGDVVGGYELFENEAEYAVNFLIQGPGVTGSKEGSQAKANKLIAIAELRKDCLAVVSPHREAVVDVTSSKTQTDNVVQFFDALTSSSYVVFDSGYKYQFDRFNNTFQYIPLNADIAGLMARTSQEQFPWFSPAGSQRGNILNTVKLAYNPSKVQRDSLYTRRVNPVIFSPGAGFVLFGDKTGLGYASAFDRINVRRLFLTLESTIEIAARTQLFEFNDDITRANFRNIVEPYLRDVQAKRGITDFVVICDETNNTPDVIDANEFKADIFIKPARSINFIGLTFVATRTGVAFEEVVGRV
jgi:phage tail sheath protein FI